MLFDQTSDFCFHSLILVINDVTSQWCLESNWIKGAINFSLTFCIKISLNLIKQILHLNIIVINKLKAAIIALTK